MIRILLVDDQAMVRTGFRMILESEEDFAVVGEAWDGESALAEMRKLKPDIVLMDIQMPGMDGLEATRRIASLKDNTATKVLMLTTFELEEYVFEALRAGACGFLLKNAPPEDLINAVRVVFNGDSLLSPSVTKTIIREFARRPAPKDYEESLQELSEREKEVARLVARGMTNDEISRELLISEATVRSHLSNVRGKLDLRDRVQVVVFAYESGLVEPGRS